MIIENSTDRDEVIVDIIISEQEFIDLYKSDIKRAEDVLRVIARNYINNDNKCILEVEPIFDEETQKTIFSYYYKFER